MVGSSIEHIESRCFLDSNPSNTHFCNPFCCGPGRCTSGDAVAGWYIFNKTGGGTNQGPAAVASGKRLAGPGTPGRRCRDAAETLVGYSLRSVAQLHEYMFYEVMWRLWARGLPYPFPWWVQQTLRHWRDFFDGGLFDSKEAAFASNANYRYWHLVGEPNKDLESLVGQAGEVEPVYDQYALSFFLFDPATKSLYLPQLAGSDGRPSRLHQSLQDGWLPVVLTQYDSGDGIAVEEKVYAVQLAPGDARSFVMLRLAATLTAPTPRDAWLCVAVTPMGPTGFQRHDHAGRYRADRRLAMLRYLAAERRVEVNQTWGPSFDTAPAHVGVYGNGDSTDPDFYLQFNPYAELATHASLNGFAVATDHIAGLCHGVFAWPMHLTSAAPGFTVDVRLPVGAWQTPADLQAMGAVPADELDASIVGDWALTLFQNGLRIAVPPALQHLADQEALSRAQLLILADRGAIHPGPTIYDSFWIRDSSVEGVACALVGQEDLAEAQFGQHYPNAFHRGAGHIGPVALDGFFGGEHERNDREWDSNGQALWAIGRFDRIKGPAFAFGQGMFTPYVVDGARWLRDNCSAYGLLHSGWSAEHLGEADKPHYWDDLWALAGLWEAAQLAERIAAPTAQRNELWQIYDDVRDATAASIRWVLDEQRRRGHWETFVPTGPADVGRLDSTMIGAVAYFHPCRLYMGAKLGTDVDAAMRHTLETIYAHFVTGGFRHDAAWNCFGPYLTLQLAHAFLLLGDLERMHQLLGWSLGNAGYAQISRGGGASEKWQVALGAWNEQHCYPVASDFTEIPGRAWYMGDMPHGWACAELILLVRDMLFFEADEDGAPHIFLIPGIRPEWLGDGESIRVQNARTVFGGKLDFTVTHDRAARQIRIEVPVTPRPDVQMVFHCRFGAGVSAAAADGVAVPISGDVVRFPAGCAQAVVTYR